MTHEFYVDLLIPRVFSYVINRLPLQMSLCVAFRLTAYLFLDEIPTIFVQIKTRLPKRLNDMFLTQNPQIAQGE